MQQPHELGKAEKKKKKCTASLESTWWKQSVAFL